MTIGTIIVVLCIFIYSFKMIFIGISLRRGATSGLQYDAFGILIYGGIFLLILTAAMVWGSLNPDKMNSIENFLNTYLW